MEFKVGQKYRIVDIDAWWDKQKYSPNGCSIVGSFKNGDILEVSRDYDYRLCFKLIGTQISSQITGVLTDWVDDKWHDSCIELITDDIADVSKMEEESDDTISLYHIADVLEDAVENYNWHDDDVEKFVDRVQECIKSLRKAGY